MGRERERELKEELKGVRMKLNDDGLRLIGAYTFGYYIGFIYMMVISPPKDCKEEGAMKMAIKMAMATWAIGRYKY